MLYSIKIFKVGQNINTVKQYQQKVSFAGSKEKPASKPKDISKALSTVFFVAAIFIMYESFRR